MFDYFIKCKIVLDFEYVFTIKRHCYSVEFYEDMDHSVWGKFQEKFAKQLSTFDNLVNSESRRKKLGKAEIYDGSVIPTNPNSNRVPGSKAVFDRQKEKASPKENLIFLILEPERGQLGRRSRRK